MPMLDHPTLAPFVHDADRQLVADVHAWLADGKAAKWSARPELFYARETWRDLARLGVLRLGIPAASGGRANPDRPSLAVAVLSDAFDGRVDVGTMLALYVQCIVGTGWLVLNQERPVVAALLPALASGTVILSTAYTDADHAAPATARRAGAGHVLSGTKKFVVNPPYADYYLVTAHGDDGALTFLVDAGWPGVTVRAQDGRLGAKGCVQSEIVFDAVQVPASHLLARAGVQRIRQWNQVMTQSRLCNAITAAYMLRHLEGAMRARAAIKAAAGGHNLLSWGRNAAWIADVQAMAALIEEGFADILGRIARGENQVARAAAFKVFAIEQGAALAQRGLELQGGDAVFGHNPFAAACQDFVCQSFSSGASSILDIYDQSCHAAALLEREASHAHA